MHILVTGANGFIGRHLVNRLLSNPAGINTSQVTVLDLNLDLVPEDVRVKRITGSFADAEKLTEALQAPADLVYHLAAVPSGAAEHNYQLGVDINIHGTMALLEKLKDQEEKTTLVFASSIAVYGRPSVAEVNDDTLPTPNLTYGAQKVIAETLIADYARRQWLNGCSIRLPGIVARPPEPNGAVSIFFSDLIRNLSSGQPFTCPVSASASSWLMSVECVVDNLVHAATLEHSGHSTWTLPALHIAIEELVNEIDEVNPGSEAGSLITYEADPWVEENFGSYPPINCPKAVKAGFHHDGSPSELIKNSLKSLT